VGTSCTGFVGQRETTTALEDVDDYRMRRKYTDVHLRAKGSLHARARTHVIISGEKSGLKDAKITKLSISDFGY
jgi:hypothetical protein